MNTGRQGLMARGFIFGAAALCGLAALLLFSRANQRQDTTLTTFKNPASINMDTLRAKAEQGEAQAQFQLGTLYAKGEGVTNSYVEASKWFGRAADQGNAEARLALGELYEAGQGVPKDVGQAMSLYRQAAEQGSTRAQYTLGFLYEAGRGVPQNQVEAANWFKRAAEHGDALSQYDLGQRFELGVGVSIDRTEALKWFVLAARQGQPDAASRRDKLKKSMTRSEISEAERRADSFPTHSVR
jgi:TPR repeat protein